MKKRVLGLSVGICMLSLGNCFAMQFSPTKKIGEINYRVGAPRGVYIEGAAADWPDYTTKDTYMDKYRNKNIVAYSKGVAKFGEGTDGLYVHYNLHERDSIRFGSKDITKTISPKNDRPYHWIYQIKSDEGITLYPVEFVEPDSYWNILGRRPDGTWVTYIDTRNIAKQYFGITEKYYYAVHFAQPIVQGDTLIMKYGTYPTKEKGEFRFRWDENAQWFGIEQIVY